MDNINLKVYVPVVIGVFVLGGIIDHFITPTKIKTVTEYKTEVKTVKDKVIVDRVITKVVKPDGTITEVITEKDRSVIDSTDKSNSSTKTVEVTNPRYLSLGFAYKGEINNFSNVLDYRRNTGIEVQYDTGIFNTYVTGSVFGDSTIIIGLGVRL